MSRWMFNIMAVMHFDLFIFADDVSHVKNVNMLLTPLLMVSINS